MTTEATPEEPVVEEPEPEEPDPRGEPEPPNLEVRVIGYEIVLDSRVVGTIGVDDDDQWQIVIPTWDRREIHASFTDHTTALYAARNIVFQQMEMVRTLENFTQQAIAGSVEIK